MVAEDGNDDDEGNESDNSIAPVLLESEADMMSTTLPAPTPNPNITVRNIQTDIHDSSTFSSIQEVNADDQQMNDYIQIRMKEAENEARQEYRELLTKRAGTSAVAGTAQGNTATVVADPQSRNHASQFAQNVHKYKKSTPSSVLAYIQQHTIKVQSNKRALLRDMHNQIASCELLTMLLGQRKKPIATSENPTGFTPGKMIIPLYNSSTDDKRSVASDMSSEAIEAENIMRNLSSREEVWISDDNIEL